MSLSVFEFEGLSPEEWADMMNNVNYNIPGQALTAAAVSSKFEDANITVTDDGSAGNGTAGNGTEGHGRRSDWPRTPVQLANYDRIMNLYDIGEKLLTTGGVKPSERAKYLSKRFGVLETAMRSLAKGEKNKAGWDSVHLDPNEEGSSGLVRLFNEFVMSFVSSANIDHDEDYPPLYKEDLKDMTVHAESPAFTLSVSKVYPENFAKYGDHLRLADFYNNHPVNPNSQWLKYDESVQVPTKLHFKNESRCGGRPFTLLTARFNGYGDMSPPRRNPLTIMSKKFNVDSNPITVDLRVNPHPAKDALNKSLDDCEVDYEQMKYGAVSIKFEHMRLTTAMRKTQWYKDDLDTDVSIAHFAAQLASKFKPKILF